MDIIGFLLASPIILNPKEWKVFSVFSNGTLGANKLFTPNDCCYFRGPAVVFNVAVLMVCILIKARAKAPDAPSNTFNFSTSNECKVN